MGSKSDNTVTVTHQVDSVFNDNSECSVVKKCGFTSNIVNSEVNTLNTDKQNGVFSRVFYNSMLRKQDVQSLLARGNKKKYLTGRMFRRGNQNNKCSPKRDNTISIQGMCESPLSVTHQKTKNSQHGIQKSAKHRHVQGVKSTMTSGHQKVAPLVDHNRCDNEVRPETMIVGGLFSSASANSNEVKGVKGCLTSGQGKVAPLGGHNRCDNELKPETMVVGGLFSPASVNSNEVKGVKGGLTSGQEKVAPLGWDNEITTSDNTNIAKQGLCFTPESGNGKQCKLTSEVTHKAMAIQNPSITLPCNKNKEHKLGGQTQDLALLYDVNGLDDDKFTNIVGNVFENQQALKVNNDYGPYFSLWRQQSRFDFGFIPLSSFILADHTEQTQPIQSPIKIHNLVKESGVYNFWGCRIPIQNQLNVDEWSRQLCGYWDTQLIDLITYGFPLDFNRKSPLKWEDRNHKSALDHPIDVDAYLREEIQHGAIMGPYSVHPINESHFSPFMTREKANASHRRVIIDLSWPKDASVNLGVDKNSYLATDFLLNLPTVDHITSELKNIGRGAHLFKVDVSRAFRHVKIDPSDYDVLGLKWKDLTYFDTCLPFGSRHGTQIFQRLSDAIRHMMRRQGFDVINYVDDFVGFGTPSVARRSYDALIQLLQKLGLEVSSKKLVPPSTKATCLGIEIDSEKCTVAIPPEKLRQISDMVDAWRHAKFCSKNQLQSLLGNLLYVQKCVKPARIFLNRMLELLRQNYDKNSITLTQNFRRDLRWFHRFLATYNGVSYFDHRKTDEILELDACLTGMGGRWGNKVYHLPIVNQFKNLAITQLEMVNILVAVKLFARDWQKRKICVKCDNLAVVQVLSKGKTKDPFLGACARNIWLIAATYDIDLSYVHIQGKLNCVADLLSRWQYSYANYAQLQRYIDNPIWCNVTQSFLDMDADI